MLQGKIRLVKATGWMASECFGKVGQEFEVHDGAFRDLDNNGWTNDSSRFESVDDINAYFARGKSPFDVCFRCEFEKVEDGENE